MFSFGGNMFGGFAPATTFEELFRCYPVAMMPDNVRKDDSNFGGKIFLPSSALNRLTMLHIRYPMLFELTNEQKGKKTHLGVLEFVAEEGRVYMPQWMMATLELQPGSIVKVASCDLPNGRFVKLEPQLPDFLDISDPKAVLENALRNFSTLTVGDTVEIDYNDSRFGIKVLEVKPEGPHQSICVVETDLETDFAPPVGYVEPEYKPKAVKPAAVSKSAGAGRMAHAVDYANIAAGSDKLQGQRLLGKPMEKKTWTVDDLDLNAAPVPFDVGPNRLFLGWPVVPPTPDESEEEAPSAYSGEGRSLRQSRKRGNKGSHQPLKNHLRSPDFIEIDD